MEKMFFVLIFIILTSLFFVSSVKEDKISQEVYEKLEKDGVVRVIIKINTGEGKMEIKKNIEEEVGKEDIRHVFSDEVAVEISEDDLDELNKNPNVKEVVIDKLIFAYLQQSIPYINASSVWPIQLSGINITGADETVCILDTGINFTHPALIGKNKTCVIDCLDKECIENCSIGDDNGHGTHVAGIVAASGGINGVGGNISLIGVKVLNSAGEGSGSDLNAAIDWCVANSATYNISVISMSLGDCSNHSTYCNDDSSTPFINNANAYNISVIVAAGNGPGGSCVGITNTNGPAAPACVQNATAIGVVNDVDNSISYQRGALFELLAPGISINSTKSTGGYIEYSGTSMAAPHVAGAFALIRQFYRLQNGRVPTPNEIKAVLNNTGKRIDDSAGSGYNFSRIDVLSAIISIDETPPNISLISPANNSVNLSQNQRFLCNATDPVGLKNITLQIWNSTSLYYENTNSTNGNFKSAEWNVLNMPYGTYKWNCLAYDLNNNHAYSSSNYTYTVRSSYKVIVIGVDGFQYNHYANMLNTGILTNFTRLLSNRGWNGTHNITGHSSTSTAPGNAELHTGLNESLTGISDNTCNNPIPNGNTTFERLENFNSNIVTGAIYGKTTCYIPNGVLGNSWQNIDWWQNRSTYSPTVWSDGTACDNSKDVATKSTEFIGNYTNSSFYLFVYFGAPDCSGHVGGDNSLNYNNSFVNVDEGLGVILNSLEANNLNGSVQIIVTADHGWNEGTTSHETANADTLVIPLITNNASMVAYSTSDSIREQCEIAPTILDFFGLPASDYQEIINNGCESMIERESISPQVTISNPIPTTYTTNSYTINITLNEDGYCEYSLDGGTTNNTLTNTGNRMFMSARTEVPNGNYVLNAYCNDTAGNRNYTESVNFSVSVSSAIIQVSGGGGSIFINPAKIYEPTIEQVSSSVGYTETLNKDDKIKFTFFDEKSSQHTLTVDYVGESFVNLTIQSNIIKLTLGIGQSAKLNLTSAEYYNLYIKLNSIENNKAKITMQTIHEEITKLKISGESIGEEKETLKTEEEIEIEREEEKRVIRKIIRDKIKNTLVIVLIVSVLVLLAERIIRWKNEIFTIKRKIKNKR